MTEASTSSQPAGVAELKVDGVYYGGWKTARITRSIEQLAATFELEITDRWPGQLAPLPIKPGQKCEMFLDGERVVTGYIHTTSPDYDANRHAIRVAGIDKTGDLVDCSAIHKSGQWNNVKLDTLASDLIKPFGIKLVVAADVGKPFASWNIQEGETVFECLERAARMRALLLTSNPAGDLVITRASGDLIEHGLVEGQNIKAARGDFSWKDRFSRYTVKGQGRLGADGDTEHSAPSGLVVDAVISRHRPLVVLAESHSENATLRDRAEWERNVRRGRGARGSVTVQGWRHAGGGLWQPNMLVPVTSPWLWLESTPMLVVACTWTLDDSGGTLTELAISRPDAFQLLEGVAQSRLFGTLRSKEERKKREQFEDWSTL